MHLEPPISAGPGPYALKVRTRNRRLLAAFLAAGGVGFWLAVLWKTSGNVFYQDFRGGTIPAAVKLAGPGAKRLIKVEPEGLRITLPKDRENLSQVGFSIPHKVPGNFEITATFEIVDAETPKDGYGVGMTMGVDDFARIGRYVRPGDAQVMLWDFWPVVDGVRGFQHRAYPCTAQSGRMRLQRTGTVLHFLWSANTSGDDFDEIHSTEYGTEDTKFFTLVAESSGQPCAVDVRVMDLRIRNVSQNASTYQWSAAAVAAMGLVAGGWLAWPTRPRKPAPVLAAPTAPPAEMIEKKVADPKPAPPAAHGVELRCPQCQKRLKVSSVAAGKKIKCPGCHALFVT